jgi:PKD repeat protein
MKKLLLPLLICYQFLSAQSPITFVNSDAPTAGWTQKIVKDTLPLPAINYGNKGANQVYDFSNLVQFKLDTVEYRTPTNAQITDVPAAGIAITTDGANFLFTKTTSTQLTLEGFEGVLAGNTLRAAYQTPPVITKFPTSYGNTFGGTGYLQKAYPGSQVGQGGVDQVRVTINTTYTDTVDGWGKLITPVGSYKCLRVKRKETTTTTNEYKLFPFSQWATAPGSPTTRTTVRYSYITKEAKGSALTFEYDSVDNLLSVSYSLIPPTAPVADFTYVNGATGLVNFTDASDNYPTQWNWNFGDGGTSTQQNPLHTFAVNGTYDVCLIATNAGGSSVQVCKQVTITNASTIPTADFNWAAATGGTINFTDQSTGGPTQWAWTFGDGGTSAQQNPSHTYTANGVYNVCLTASNNIGSTQYCENVTVTGVATAPVAEFAWVNTSGGLVNFTDQSTNTPTQWSWTFGDGGTSTSQNPNHVYTANGNYNVCLTASNTGGSNQHCETVTVNGISAGNNPPFAVNDTVSLTQATSITIFHVGNNDLDPDNDPICLTAVWGSPYVTEYIGGSCDMVSIVPDSNFVGTDTAWYTVCDDGVPALCDTGLLIFTVVANPGLYPTAVNDNATALQPDGTTVNVTQNDITPVNPVCVTVIYGGGNTFAINGCNNITYTPDSLFTGNDTVWYVVCDNGHATWCDTAMLVVTSNANPALLPQAGFTWQELICQGVIFTNTSVNAGTAVIVVSRLDTNEPDSTYNISNQVHYYGTTPTNPLVSVQACITASNQFGSSTFCDTVQFICEGINSVLLSSVQLYPNPAQSVITIDMSQNNEETTRNYTAIEIFNVVGEKVKHLNGNQANLLAIPVAEMPDGMYVATLTDAKGVRYTLGRFTVTK